MRYTFYEDDEPEEAASLKFKVGDQLTKIPAIEHLTLTFAFDYVSLDSTNFCFNNNTITADDFRELFHFKKAVSKVKIKDLIDEKLMNRRYHFHSIDLIQKKFLLEPLKQLLGYSRFIEVYKLPSLYQLAVYTDNTEQKAPRIVGFFGKNAVFHILWFDYDHQIYPVKKA